MAARPDGTSGAARCSAVLFIVGSGIDSARASCASCANANASRSTAATACASASCVSADAGGSTAACASASYANADASRSSTCASASGSTANVRLIRR